jgi:hypothetical protein
MPLLNFLFPSTTYFPFQLRTLASFFLSSPFSSFGHSLFKPVSYICEKKFFFFIFHRTASELFVTFDRHVLTAVRNFVAESIHCRGASCRWDRFLLPQTDPV